MTGANERRTGRRGGRARIRTAPPIVLLVGVAGATGALTAADLIAQARAARREADGRDGVPAARVEQG